MEAHARAVLDYVRQLRERGAPGDPEIATLAAILHDVGIPQALRLYGSAGPPGQEVEGAVIANDLLARLGCPRKQIDLITAIIAMHHHRPVHPSAEFQLVYDADQLVNAQEQGQPLAEISERLYTPQARAIASQS